MDKIVLKVQARDVNNERARDVRKEKLVPGVFYAGGKEAKHFKVPYEVFRKTYRDAGATTIVDLEFEDGKKEKALIHEVTYHPVKDTIDHVDMWGVNLKEAITANIPLEFVGESNAVKNFGGIFMSTTDELEVKCLPGDLVQSIEVDISSLAELGDSIHLEDLTIPEGMEVLNEEGTSICLVQAPKEEEPEEEVVAEGEEGAVPSEHGGDDAADEEKSEE